MSGHRRYWTKKDSEQGSAMRPKTETSDGPRSDLPRLTPLSGLAAFPRRLWQAGNAAIDRLLGRQQSGRPLEPNMRKQMEQGLGENFEKVRIHDDTAAQCSAAALDAEAFTHGEDIYIGAGAPNVESAAGQTLLTHELAHVVQQRQAGESTVAAISQPGDQFERAADVAAHQAMEGGQAHVSVSGSPPAIQRKEKQRTFATRAEAKAALQKYFEREMQAQGRKEDLRVTQQVKDTVLHILFGDDVFGQLKIQSELNRFDLRMPDEFASAIAQRLPDTIDRSRIEALNRMSGREPTPSLPGRIIRELVESTAPGEPERPEIPSAAEEEQQRAERAAQLSRQLRGEEEPTEVGPVSVDIPRAVRIVRGLPEAIRGPRTPRLAPPETRTYPPVEQAIESLSPDALIPAEARGTARAGSFADTREVARDLARRLDVAQQQGQDTIDLRLGDNYNQVRDRTAMIREIERIVTLIRDALPHHAAIVRFVDVYFGNRLVTRSVPRRSE
jgi:Domain of unknown function (DUF4157)